MSATLAQLIGQLSEQDRLVFEGLALRLQQVKGDINLLDEADRELIASMERKYAADRPTPPKTTELDPAFILETPFAEYVRQILARDLVEQFPLEADAVQFAFNSKWLPIDCQDSELAQSLFERFEDDVRLCNQWRDTLVSVDEDTRMAVGIAWFMVVYQLYQRNAADNLE